MNTLIAVCVTLACVRYLVATLCDEEPKKIKHGFVDVSHNRRGDGVATYSCLKGNTLVGVWIRQCEHGGYWSDNPPLCVPNQDLDLECTNPPDIEGAKYILRYNEKFIGIGSQATYSCLSGFSKGNNGTELAICNHQRVWEAANMTCVKKLCDDLKNISHGWVDIAYNLRSYGVATYRCENDYTLVGDKDRHCEHEGSWSDYQPLCVPNQDINLTCTDPPDVSGATYLLRYGVYFKGIGSQAFYSCQSGFFKNNNGTKLATCITENVWEGPTMTCDTRFCNEQLQTIKNGFVDVTYNRRGDGAALYSCQDGYTLVGAFTRNCKHGGYWSDNAPFCVSNTDLDLKCTDPPDIDRATYILSYNDEFIRIGSQATYSCISGFSKGNNGTEFSVCNSERVWEAANMTCVKKVCDDLGNISHGWVEIAYNLRSYGVATYRCENGYTFVGDEIRHCEPEGRWSDYPAACVRNQYLKLKCADPPNIHGANYILRYSADYKDVGNQAIYYCLSEYIKGNNGTEIATCINENVWEGPTMICLSNRCGEQMKNIDHGRVHLTVNSRNEIEAMYSCESGYTLVGTRSRQCQPDGYLSDYPPVCVSDEDMQLPCSGPPHLYGADYIVHKFGRIIGIGSQAFYFCRSEYFKSNNGTEFATCNIQRIWDEPTMTCDLIQCLPELENITHGKVDICPANQVGAIASYSCDKGYTLEGHSMRECQLNGTWTGVVPRCVSARQCQVPSIPSIIISNGQAGHLKDHGFTLEVECAGGFFINDNQAVKCRDGDWTFLPRCEADGDTRVCEYETPDNPTWPCSKSCRSDKNCRKNTKCLCDGRCGRSCINPTECRVPAITNATIRGAQEGQWRKPGFIIKAKCADGHMLNDTREMQCQNGAWSVVIGCVPARQCLVPDFLNATIVGGKAGDMIRHDFTIQHKCDEGFYINDTGAVKCWDGEWTIIPSCVADGDTRVCEHKRQNGIDKLCFRKCQSDRDCANLNKLCLCDGECGRSCILTTQCKLPIIMNATITGGRKGDYQNSGFTIIPKCDPGLVLNDARPVTCMNGTWTVIPNCVPADPCIIPAIMNATIQDALEGDLRDHGITIQPICDGGFRISDTQAVTCQHGNWSIIPACVPDGNTRACEYEKPDNPIWPCSKSCRSDKDCRRHSKCLCDGRCGRSCVNPNECRVPIIMNATILGSQEGQWRRPGFIIKPKCADGHMLNDTREMKCQNGDWSVIIGCVPARQCQVPDILNATIVGGNVGDMIRHDLTIKLKCDEGFYINDTGAVRCWDGEWSIIPSCVADGDTRACEQKRQDGNDKLKLCFKKCQSDRDCAKLNRVCLCDGVCGRTCIMTTQCKLPIIMNATITGGRKGEYQNSDVTIIPKCDTRLVLDDARPVTCMMGNWSVIPKCVPERCKVPVIDYGYIPGGVEGDLKDHGSTIVPKCYGGFIISDPQTVLCEKGNWSIIPKCVTDGDTRVCAYNESQANTTRECSKSCHSDRDCADAGRKCFCDGECARSCIDSTQCHVPLIENANVTGDSEREWQDHNSSIELKCNSGFVLYEIDTITCQNGSWSTIPQCVPGPCPVPDIQNARISGGHSGELIDHGLTIEPNCNVGFYISQSGPISCDKGSWTIIPTCVPDGDTRECEDKRQDDKNMRCTKSCQSDRDCTGRRKKCLCDGTCGRSCIIPDQCRVPAIVNGTFTGEHEGEWINNGVTIKPTCDIGHVVNNSRPVTCVNGTWSIIPSCVPDQCRVLALANGTFTETQEGEWINNGITIKPKCDIGHVVNGSQSVTCVNGTWSIIPSCVPGAQCQIPAIMNGTFVGGKEGDLRDHDFTIEPICADGFRLNTTKAVTCDNGDWSIIPECVPVGVTRGCDYEKLDNSSRECAQSCLTDKECVQSKTCVCDGECGKCCIDSALLCKEPENPPNGEYYRTISTPTSWIKLLCITGYSVAGQAYRTCQASGTWSGQAPTCEAICHFEPPEVNKSQRRYYGNFHGVTVNYVCNHGYKHSHKNSVLTCWKGQWVGEMPICVELARCTEPQHRRHGKYHGTNFTETSVITLKCNEGYRILGQTVRRCQDDGTWSGQAATCRVISCRELESPPDGRIDSRNFTFSSVITLICRKGYTVVGSEKRTCKDDGTWSGHAATCEVSCGKPKEFAHSHPNYNNTVEGSTVDYTCDTGYGKYNKTHDFICVSGKWLGDFDGCKKYLDCDKLPDPIYGYYHDFKPQRFPFNSVVHLVCSLYYRKDVNVKRRCLEDRTWSEPVPTCEKHCILRPPPPHVNNSERIQTGREPRDTVTYKCNEGYVLSTNNSVITCWKGEWVGETPVCSKDDGKISCGLPMEDKHAHRNYNCILEGCTANYTCHKGYGRYNQTPDFTCLSGKWVGDFGGCHKYLECDKLPDPIYGYYHDFKPTRFPFNSVVHLVCNTYYRKDVDVKRRCLEDRTWSEPVPTCEKHCIMQQPPPDIDNSERIETGREHKDTVTYKCKAGYAHSTNNSVITCWKGEWVGETPVCSKIITCNTPQRPPHGRIEGTDFTFGSVIKLVCEDGFVVVGPEKRTCMANSSWSEYAAYCEESCGLPKDYNYSLKNYNGVVHGRTVNYTCEEGYGRYLGHPPDFTCLNGKWVGYFSGCEKYLYCDAPRNPEFGEYFGDREYKFEAVVILECNTGYTVVGQSVRRCNEDRTWSGSAPKCEKDCPCEPPHVDNSTHLSDGCIHGHKVTYSCKDGFSFGSENTVLKCYKGQWQGEIPICTKSGHSTTTNTGTTEQTTTIPYVDVPRTTFEGKHPCTHEETRLAGCINGGVCFARFIVDQWHGYCICTLMWTGKRCEILDDSVVYGE